MPKNFTGVIDTCEMVIVKQGPVWNPGMTTTTKMRVVLKSIKLHPNVGSVKFDSPSVDSPFWDDWSGLTQGREIEVRGTVIAQNNTPLDVTLNRVKLVSKSVKQQEIQTGGGSEAYNLLTQLEELVTQKTQGRIASKEAIERILELEKEVDSLAHVLNLLQTKLVDHKAYIMKG